jgi:hypothetical protein
MSARLNLVISRIQKLHKVSDDHPMERALRSDIERLRRRARLLSDGIASALVAGLCAAVLLALLFISEFFGFHHAYGGALFFTIATLALGWGLLNFFREALLGLAEADEYE